MHCRGIFIVINISRFGTIAKLIKKKYKCDSNLSGSQLSLLPLHSLSARASNGAHRLLCQTQLAVLWKAEEISVQMDHARY
jgi:hypothetical protein